MGKHIEVAYFDNAASRDLLNSADYLHPLDTKFFTGLWTTGARQYAHRRKTPRYRKVNAVPVINAAGMGEQITPQEQRPAPDIPPSPD
jgi:hypothetical protein